MRVFAGNSAALADLSGHWIESVLDRTGRNYIVLYIVGFVSPTHGEQEGTAGNGHSAAPAGTPLFLINQFGMPYRLRW